MNAIVLKCACRDPDCGNRIEISDNYVWYYGKSNSSYLMYSGRLKLVQFALKILFKMILNK